MRYGYESAWCEPEVAGRQPSRIAPEVIKQKTTQVAKRFLLALRQARKVEQRCSPFASDDTKFDHRDVRIDHLSSSPTVLVGWSR